jgi:hypothetical protein
MTISIMTNVSALPKSDIVSDADLALAAAAGALRSPNWIGNHRD